MPTNIHKRVIIHKSGEEVTLWYVILEMPRLNDGKRKQVWHGGYKSLEHAEAMRDEFKEQMRRETYVYKRKLTLQQWCENYWFPSIKNRLKPSTLHGYQQDLRLYVYPEFCSIQLTSITAERIDRLYQNLIRQGGYNSRPLSRATVRGVHVILRACLEEALDLGYIRKNPADKTHPPTRKEAMQSTYSCWSIKEIQTFLDGIRGSSIEMILRLAVFTGMRRGEILGLRWRDVNFTNSRISVSNSIIQVNGEVVQSTPKSNRSRTVDIDHDLNERLWLLKMDQETWAPNAEDDEFPQDLVFRDVNGKRHVPTRVSNQFNKIVRDLSLPKIRFHDLRHTHASHCLAMGIPVNVVQERLGHANPETTLKLYAHVLPGSQSEAAIKFSEALQTHSVILRKAH